MASPLLVDRSRPARIARMAALAAGLALALVPHPGRGDDPPKGDAAPAGRIVVRALYCGTEPGIKPDGLVALDPESGEARMTDGLLTPGEPSPDGRFIAYANQGAVWLHDTTGERPARRVFDREGDPSWTDRGRSLIVAAEAKAGAWETWRVALDGDGRVRLPIPANLLVLDASPDGSWLAAREVGDGSEHWGGLTLIRPDGTGARHLTEGSAAKDVFSVFRFSPDGCEVADVEIRTVDDVRTSRIFVMDLEGKHRRELAVPLERGYTAVPAWSPDGSRLALGLAAQQASAIAVVDRDGRHYRKLPLPPWPWFHSLCGWSR